MRIYIMLCKYVKRTCEFLGGFIFILFIFLYFADVHTSLAIYHVISVQHAFVK